MNRTILCIIFLLCSLSAFSQGKKATLMILPSDNWCNQRFFMTTFDNQGSKVIIPDYPRAFREDPEVGPVISKIGELMTGLGYSLKDAAMELRNLSNREAEDNVTTSESGADLGESPLDILKRRTKTDIIIQVSWRLNSNRSLTFTLEAFDSYTSKRIATATGTGKPDKKNNIVPVLLENAVKQHLKGFNKQMLAFYDQTQKDGREIALTIRRWSDWDKNLNSEINGSSVLTHIEEWLHKNTVKSQFNLSDQTRNTAQFEQVRIPITDKNGRDVDARSFAIELQRHLRAAPYNIQSEVMIRGLGEAILVLGQQ